MPQPASERAIVESIAAKVFEAIERTERLVSLVPADRLHWRPEFPSHLAPASNLGHVLGHLLDCLAGFCAAFQPVFPVELADFPALRSLPVNQFCSVEEARKGIKTYACHIERAFRCCSNADLARKVPTVFVSEGETLATLLLGNLEHLLNHKYQLFLYLKLAGVALTTSDLYRLRGARNDTDR